MKKSNLVTLLSLCFIIVAVILFMFLWKTPSASSGTKTEINSTTKDTSENTSSTETEGSSEASTSTIETSTTYTSEATSSTETEGSSEASISTIETSTTEDITTQPKSDISMDDALFIGDSRTVGLMEYAGIDGADYFCTVGMSVFNIHNKPVSVPNVGKVTLTELLNSKKYGKIYIMLGINELGYEFGSIVEKYSELIEFVKGKQSDAVVFIQANLHVTKSRSDSDKVINNTAINKLNTELAKLADGKNKFYLDANILFDDNTGGLSSDKSEDNAHIYAKYYIEWGKWIIKQTASLIGEG